MIRQSETGKTVEEVKGSGIRTCLNCGAEVGGNFCPNCGQQTDTGRFSGRSFVKHTFGALMRVSSNFFVTVFRLLTRPWGVVRDYVYGRRVGLVSPVNMILLLSLYDSVISAVVSFFGNKADDPTALSGNGWYVSVMNYFYSSLSLQYLVLAIPLSISTYLVYRKDIKGKYNFAEIVIATLFLACTYMILAILFTPLEFISEPLSNVVVAVVTLVFGVLSLNKAFPQSSRLMTCVKIGLWLILCVMFTTLLFAFLALPVALDEYGH